MAEKKDLNAKRTCLNCTRRVTVLRLRGKAPVVNCQAHTEPHCVRAGGKCWRQ